VPLSDGALAVSVSPPDIPLPVQRDLQSATFAGRKRRRDLGTMFSRKSITWSALPNRLYAASR